MYPKHPSVKLLFDAVTDESLSPEERYRQARRAIDGIYESKITEDLDTLDPSEVVDIDYDDGEVGTALEHAIKKNYSDIAILLLNDAGANQERFFLLVQTFAQQDTAMTETLITILKAIRLSKKDKQQLESTLFNAASHGQTQMVDALLQAGVDCKRYKKNNYPALNYAVFGGHTEIVKLLMEKMTAEAKDNPETYWEDIQAMLLDQLNDALRKSQTEIVKMILDGVCWNKKSKQVMTEQLLLYVAYNGNVEIMRALLRAGADCQYEKKGRTALSYAAEQGHSEIVQILLENFNRQAGVDPNYLQREKNTALAYAVDKQQVKTIITLLKNNADIESLDSNRKARCLLMVANSQLPKPFIAEEYNNQFIENLGIVLLQQLPLSRATIANMSNEFTYLLGAYFINALAGQPIKLPDDLFVYLSGECLLEHNKAYLDQRSRFKAVGNENQILQIREADHAKFAEKYNQQYVVALFTPRSLASVEGYLEDYKFIGNALHRMDNVLYEGLDKFDSSKSSAMEYCLTVLDRLNKNNKAVHIHTHEEVKTEIRTETIAPSTKQLSADQSSAKQITSSHPLFGKSSTESKEPPAKSHTQPKSPRQDH